MQLQDIVEREKGAEAKVKTTKAIAEHSKKCLNDLMQLSVKKEEEKAQIKK